MVSEEVWIFSRKASWNAVCVCVRLLQIPPWIYLSSITINSNSSLNLSALLLLLLLHVCSITVRFSLLFSEFLPLVWHHDKVLLSLLRVCSITVRFSLFLEILTTLWHHDKVYVLYVVRICGIRNNVEHLCNSNLLLYYVYLNMYK